MFKKVYFRIVAASMLLSLALPTSAQAAGNWIQSGTKWWYKHSDGSYTKNNWEKINGKWYYFDNNGWMKEGWIQRPDGKWYYLNPGSGDMRTSKLDLGGAVYEFDSVNGNMYVTKLKVTWHRQEKENWCWAASSEMVGDYMGNNLSQNQIVRVIYPNLDNKGANIKQINRALDYAVGSRYSTGYNEGHQSAAGLRAYIDNKKPFISSVFWTQTSGHAITGYGYDLSSGSILYYDPAMNVRLNNYAIPFNVIENRISYSYGDSGIGKYSWTNYIR